MPTYSWVSPTGSAVGANWNNAARAYDGNWDNYADYTTTNGLGTYATLTFAALYYLDRLQFKYGGCSGVQRIEIDILNNTTGNWDSLINGKPETMKQLEVVFPTTYSDRIRVRFYLSGSVGNHWGWLYEVRAERVVSDDPVVPPPNPPESIQVAVQKDTARRSFVLGYGRFRSIHRRTKLEPWIAGGEGSGSGGSD